VFWQQPLNKCLGGAGRMVFGAFGCASRIGNVCSKIVLKLLSVIVVMSPAMWYLHMRGCHHTAVSINKVTEKVHYKDCAAITGVQFQDINKQIVIVPDPATYIRG
jgi:hypothetical protein